VFVLSHYAMFVRILRWFYCCCCTGFSASQANCLVQALVQISSAKVDFMHKNMVTKPQQVSVYVAFSFGLFAINRSNYDQGEIECLYAVVTCELVTASNIFS
jgi:hypothetical protein